MSSYIQSNQIIKIPNVPAYSVSAADTGKIMITPQTVGAINVVCTLPLMSPGLHFKFINGSPLALDGNIEIVGEAGSIFGSVLSGPVDGVAFKEIDGDTNLFFDAESVKGDFIDLYCDGDYWFVHAVSRVAAGIV